jgi:hypothetical protein
MTDGTTPDVFGGGGDDLFADDFPDQGAPEATETPEQAPAEQPTEAPQPAPEATPETPEATPEVEAPSEEQPLIGGKFKTTDDLLLAYQNSERIATQRAQDAARTRQEVEQLRQRNQTTEQVLRELQPVLEGIQSGAIEAPGFDVENPQQVQALIDRQVEQKLQERLAPIQQQQEQAVVEQRMAEIQAFRSKHPDAAPHEESISFVVSEYRYDPDTKEEVFPPTADNLELAYTLATRPDVKALVDEVLDVPDPDVVKRAQEALDNPQLATFVQGMPELILRDQGMALARQLAGMPAVVTNAQDKATEAQKLAAQATRKAAHVEVDSEVSSTGSAPGAPQDFLAEAVAEIEAQQKKSVFL